MAENGIKGIEKAARARETGMPFAVAFIDIEMPGLDGAQAAKRIWGIDPHVKIVIVTAYSDYTPEEIISVIGRDDIFYLRKPFNYEEILQFARALVNEWNLERSRDKLEENLKTANGKLADINAHLKTKVQQQAVLIAQAEKMASIGILAAGVAHEINNPLSFVTSNLATIKSYLERIITLYEKMTTVVSFFYTQASPAADTLLKDLSVFKEENKIEHIFRDLDCIADESIEGIDRIKMIVRDLQNFSRLEKTQSLETDINKAIETALHMVWNELKHKAAIEKNWATSPWSTAFPKRSSRCS